MITTRHKLTRYGTSLAVVLGVHAIAIAIALSVTVSIADEMIGIFSLIFFVR